MFNSFGFAESCKDSTQFFYIPYTLFLWLLSNTHLVHLSQLGISTGPSSLTKFQPLFGFHSFFHECTFFGFRILSRISCYIWSSPHLLGLLWSMTVSWSPLVFGDPDSFEECWSDLLNICAVCLVCVQTLSLVPCCFSHDETEFWLSRKNSEFEVSLSHPFRTVRRCTV